VPKLSDLRFNEGPHPSDRYDRLRATIDWMRESGRFDWADKTLAGIYDSITERGFVSDAQWDGVKNIWNARLRDRDFGDLED